VCHDDDDDGVLTFLIIRTPALSSRWPRLIILGIYIIYIYWVRSRVVNYFWVSAFYGTRKKIMIKYLDSTKQTNVIKLWVLKRQRPNRKPWPGAFPHRLRIYATLIIAIISMCMTMCVCVCVCVCIIVWSGGFCFKERVMDIISGWSKYDSKQSIENPDNPFYILRVFL